MAAGMQADAPLDLTRNSGDFVSQNMISNVLAVCPHLEPDKILEDLKVTGSATSTINRVFEGQFLSGTPGHSLSSTGGLVGNSSCSGTVQELSDSDDEDKEFLMEERQTLFTSLRSRFDSISNRKSSSKENNINTLSSMKKKTSDQNPGLETQDSRRTCDIVDLSFSEDELSEVKVVKQQSLKIHTNKNSSDNLVIVNEEDPGPSGEMTKIHFKEKDARNSSCGILQTENNLSRDSSDDEDIPSMLPSASQTFVQKPSVHLSQHHNSESFETQSDETLYAGSDIVPKKKRKRSPEEIALAKQDALLQREARERDRQRKREAKENEKKERQEAALLKRMEKEKDKLTKKAKTMTQKTHQRRDCVKLIQVCIDPGLISGEAEDTLLLQKIVELGASYSLDPQPVPCSVTWKRAIIEHSVGDELQISSRTSYVEEDLCAVCIPVDQFVEMVFIHKEGTDVFSSTNRENLVSFSRKMLRLFPEKTLTIVVIGVEKYFRNVKAKQQRQFREQVRGSSSSDGEKSTSKRKKKAPKCTGASVAVSRVDVEDALVDLQLNVGCNVRMCETHQDLASYITMMTKAVAESPHKRTQPDAFSFCVEGSAKGSVKISKDGEGLMKAWQQQLQQFRNVSVGVAAAIVAEYPSLQSLLRAYGNCQTDDQAAKLLQDILVRRGTGVLASTRRIGPELSRRVYMLFNSQDGELSLK